MTGAGRHLGHDKEKAGEVDDMNSDGTTKKVYVGMMEERRSRGRPRMRWIDNSK